MPVRNNSDLFNTYTYRIEDTQFKIIPIIRRGGTRWEIRIFRDHQQGPVWTGTSLTKEVLAQFDLPELPQEKVDEINETTEWANEFLEYDTSFNRKQRGQASISELAEMTGTGRLVDKLSD